MQNPRAVIATLIAGCLWDWCMPRGACCRLQERSCPPAHMPALMAGCRLRASAAAAAAPWARLLRVAADARRAAPRR